jgi:hypothetical protein
MVDPRQARFTALFVHHIAAKTFLMQANAIRCCVRDIWAVLAVARPGENLQTW